MPHRSGDDLEDWRDSRRCCGDPKLSAAAQPTSSLRGDDDAEMMPWPVQALSMMRRCEARDSEGRAGPHWSEDDLEARWGFEIAILEPRNGADTRAGALH